MKKNNIKTIFIYFLMLQPFLDIFILFDERVVDFFKFSPSTIIRMGVLGFICLYLLLSKKIKEWKLIIPYCLLLIIYTLFHIKNASYFNLNISEQYSFSLISELFYIVRMILPLLVAYITNKIELTHNDEIKIFKTFLALLIGIIFITNIFCLSLMSYGEGYKLISSNIFSWFLGENNYYTNNLLASKGLFNSANQMSALISMLLPITFYYLIKGVRAFKLIFPIQILVLLMLGTRIASYIWIPTVICLIIVYLLYTLFFKTLKLNKNNFLFILIIFLLGLSILQVAPIKKRLLGDDYAGVAEELLETNKEHFNILIEKYKYAKNEEKVLIMEEIMSNYQETLLLNPEFVNNIYPYKKDHEFWMEVIDKPFKERNDSRQIEKYITERIYSLNDNKKDKYLGMSFSRFSNGGLYYEKDFLVHFYTLGLFGSFILIYPYIFTIFIAIYYLIKNIKKANDKHLRVLIFTFSLSLACVISYFSGSVLDQLIVSLTMGFIAGLILKEITGGSYE